MQPGADENEVYFAVNPDLLDEKIWSYRQLQCLAKRVGVKANGTRSNLVERLQKWHKNGMPDLEDEDMEDSENKPPEENQKNFHMLQVMNDPKQLLVSPSKLLSPFGKNQRYDTTDCATPSSILKSKPRTSPRCATPEACPLTPNSRKRLEFSPYNKVAIVPPRDKSDRYFLNFMRTAPQFSGEEEADDTESSSGEEELEAARNAEVNAKLTAVHCELGGAPAWHADCKSQSNVEQLVDAVKGLLSPSGQAR